jgi:23S rRNA pseudouridine1911/1915/1917 synthase
VAKPSYVELGSGRSRERIPILYEDRVVLAMDKPPGWMLVPFTWQRTDRNLQAAIQSAIGAGAFWARSRNIRFLRFIHRLDAETSGVLLFGKTPGAVRSMGELFERREVQKRYLAVVARESRQGEWTVRSRLAKDPEVHGRVRVDRRHGKEAETRFHVVARIGGKTLIEAFPTTGRTHQIRVHLSHSGLPIIGDSLYGGGVGPLALRAVELGYLDPFTSRRVRITAPEAGFLSEFGFESR